MDKKIIIFSVEDRDCVPGLSLGSVARLLTSLRAVDTLELGLDAQLAVLAGAGAEDREQLRFAVAEAGRESRLPCLLHPGSVIRLDTLQRLANKEAEMLATRMEIHETMVTDHLHTAYRHTLDKYVF